MLSLKSKQKEVTGNQLVHYQETKYEFYMRGRYWLIGILFTILKFCYNLAYLAIKYIKIEPEDQKIYSLIQSVDQIYLGLLVANLFILFTISIAAKCKPRFCKLLQYWTVIGLFIESFQWYIFVKQIEPYDCEEHQLRTTSFIPLTYMAAALIQDSCVFMPPIRIVCLVMLSYYDESCGTYLSRENYLVWIISEGIVFWIVCIGVEVLKKSLYNRIPIGDGTMTESHFIVLKELFDRDTGIIVLSQVNQSRLGAFKRPLKIEFCNPSFQSIIANNDAPKGMILDSNLFLRIDQGEDLSLKEILFRLKDANSLSVMSKRTRQIYLVSSEKVIVGQLQYMALNFIMVDQNKESTINLLKELQKLIVRVQMGKDESSALLFLNQGIKDWLHLTQEKSADELTIVLEDFDLAEGLRSVFSIFVKPESVTFGEGLPSIVKQDQLRLQEALYMIIIYCKKLLKKGFKEQCTISIEQIYNEAIISIAVQFQSNEERCKFESEGEKMVTQTFNYIGFANQILKKLQGSLTVETNDTQIEFKNNDYSKMDILNLH